MNDGQWNELLFRSVGALWERLAGFLPRLALALVVLLVGWILARVFRALIKRVLVRLGLNRLAERAGLGALLERARVSTDAASLLATVGYWTLLLMALLSAADVLGLEQVGQTLDSVVDYLPSVFGAGLILVVGVALMGAAQRSLTSFLDGLGSPAARPAGKAAYWLGILVVVGLAVAQLRIETRFFEILAALLVGCAGLAVAFALGYGARVPTANILAGFYGRDVYRPGERVRIDGRDGVLVEVGATLTRVALDDGAELRVPNTHLTSTTIEVVGGMEES